MNRYLEKGYKFEVEEKKEVATATVSKPSNALNLDDLFEDEIKKEDAPILPMSNDEEEYDLQKELEAKFDELFGPIDED